VDAVRRLRTPEQLAAAFAPTAPGQRWPLLFLAVWSLIHLQGASPKEALSAVVGEV
jgi:asparagine synthase (glutamine-hydrolysing)